MHSPPVFSAVAGRIGFPHSKQGMDSLITNPPSREFPPYYNKPMEKKGSRPLLKPIYLLQDNPRDDLDFDYLGIEPWARVVAGTAVRTPGPFTIGVYKEWGYGKTTLLHMARCLVQEYEQNLDDKDRFPHVTVWFNAWQFEQEKNPLFSLIAAITDSIEHKLEEGTLKQKLEDMKGPMKAAYQKLKDIGLSLRALTRGMKFSGELAVPFLTKFGVEFDAKKALDAEEILGKQADPLQQELLYHGAFKKLREVAAEKEGEIKIIVFVDDLDRCNPEKAVHLLESIKLVLSQPGFIFVLAVDNAVIETYLDKVYVDEYGFEDKGRGKHYMEKLVQLQLQIPPHDNRFAEFVKKLVGEVEKAYGGDVKVSALQGVQDVLGLGAATNPRRVVRLINSFLIDAHLWEETKSLRTGGTFERYADLDETTAKALAVHSVLRESLGEAVVDLLLADHETLGELQKGTFGEARVEESDAE